MHYVGSESCRGAAFFAAYYVFRGTHINVHLCILDIASHMSVIGMIEKMSILSFN